VTARRDGGENVRLLLEGVLLVLADGAAIMAIENVLSPDAIDRAIRRSAAA
jgi:hypothetical protein